MLLALVTCHRKPGPPVELRVTEAEPNIRAFLERRLDYRQRAQLAIQVLDTMAVMAVAAPGFLVL
jgi:hypothetical protein